MNLYGYKIDQKRLILATIIATQIKPLDNQAYVNLIQILDEDEIKLIYNLLVKKFLQIYTKKFVLKFLEVALTGDCKAVAVLFNQAVELEPYGLDKNGDMLLVRKGTSGFKRQ